MGLYDESWCGSCGKSQPYSEDEVICGECISESEYGWRCRECDHEEEETPYCEDCEYDMCPSCGYGEPMEEDLAKCPTHGVKLAEAKG